MEQLKAIILAAGKGTRMKSELPKVVHRIDGQCLVDYVIDAAKGAGATDICLVVGYKHEVVEAEISHKDVQYALQTEQLGTGHAVKCAGDFLTGEGETLILFGDTPLITADTLKRLKDYHREKGNTVTVLSAMVDDPTGYGRIIRDENGNFNAQGEYYLPDTLTIIKNKGLKADAFALENAEDITGVNDQQQLAEAAEIIEKRKQTHS